MYDEHEMEDAGEKLIWRPDRRCLLKSAGVLLGASALNRAVPGAAARAASGGSRSTKSYSAITCWDCNSPTSNSRPELLQQAVAAEQAGSTMSASATISSPGKQRVTRRTSVTMGPVTASASHVDGHDGDVPLLSLLAGGCGRGVGIMSVLSPGRVFLGIGSGEALNEQARHRAMANGRSAAGAWWRRRRSFGRCGAVSK